MRVRRIRIDAFGRLSDFDTGPEPLGDLIVVLGPNESGKSTLFSFLTTALYGFYPASRDSHPYAPWQGGDASGTVELDVGDETVEIHRRLLSSPAGTLVVGDRQEDLRNRTVSFAEHVPLEVFREVFALTLDELAALEGAGWSRVQDRLVSGMGSTDLRLPRDVAEELESEAGAIWRPNQRGHQSIRVLRERRRELTRRRREAAEEDRVVRQSSEELARMESRIAEARRERERCRVYIERYRGLLPIREQLARIEGLEAEAGPDDDLETIPAEPGRRLEELGELLAEGRERLEEIRAGLDGARARVAALDDDALRLLERREAVRAVRGRVAALEPVRVRIGQLEQELRDFERRISTLVDGLFDVDATPVDASLETAVRGLSPERIGRAVEEARVADEMIRAAETGVEAHPASRGVPGWAPILLLGVVAAALLAAGIAAGSTALVVVGAVAALAVAVLAGGRWQVEGHALEPRRDNGSAEARADRARRDLRETFGDLPVRDEVVIRPSAELSGRIERLQELARDREDRRTQLEELRSQTEATAAEVHELGADLHREVPVDPGAASHVLDEALREAERRRDVAEAAEREIERFERERDRLRARVDTLAEEDEALHRRLRSIGEGDLTRGARLAAERLQARERARQLRTELERSHPDLPEIRRRIVEAEEAGEDWVVDDEALARRRAREDELTQEIEELAGRIEGLEKEIEYRSRGKDVAELEGEIRAVRARIADEARERDRLWVMASLIREADRRFREEHQPDILQRAGRWLATITEDRYDRLLVDEERESTTFHLRGSERAEPVAVGGSLSTGTREQAYLALRLAVLSHLDRGGERLPVFLDEALVNWDRRRRRGAVALLGELSRERQFFVFTCHEPIAEEMREQGARLLRLTLPDAE